MARAPLGPYLDAVAAAVPLAERVATDPIRFPLRYDADADVEVAAVVAASLAFGRVSLFGPVLHAIFATADAVGGPAALADHFATDPRPGPLAGLYYRWLTDADLAGLLATLGRARRMHGSVGALFPPGAAAHTLGVGVLALRAHLPADASPALRTLFAHPGGGSACKRWCMLLRWMVRTAPPDLGRWRHLSPAGLVIPVDTHVFRVAGFLGLTARATPGWAAAEEITAALRRADPSDPLRYDFALAHLGISGACLGHRDDAVCPQCPLDGACEAPATGTLPAKPGRGARSSTNVGRARRGTA